MILERDKLKLSKLKKRENKMNFSWEYAKGMFLILLIYVVMAVVPIVAVVIYEERKKEVSRYLENDCVGCPQGCAHCGRNVGYYVYECDECGKTIMSEDDFYQEDGKDYCGECYSKLFEEEEDE